MLSKLHLPTSQWLDSSHTAMLSAAEEVLVGWEAVAGHAARDAAYWDIVALLSTPPDMAGFVAAISGQGRLDLTQQLLLRRRDEFLAAALAALPTAS